MTAQDDERARALAGMAAAVEFCKVSYRLRETIASSPGDTASVAELAMVLASVRADCAKGGLQLDEALSAIALRAAQLACQASAAAGKPLTVWEFLGELEAELTPPEDPSGLAG